MNGKTKTYSACKDNLEQYQVQIMQFSLNMQVLFLSCCLLQPSSPGVVLISLLWSFSLHIVMLLACDGCNSRLVFLAFVSCNSQIVFLACVGCNSWLVLLACVGCNSWHVLAVTVGMCWLSHHSRCDIPVVCVQSNAANGRDPQSTPLHVCQCPSCFTAFAKSNGVIECVPKCDLADCDESTGVCSEAGSGRGKTVSG